MRERIGEQKTGTRCLLTSNVTILGYDTNNVVIMLLYSYYEIARDQPQKRKENQLPSLRTGIKFYSSHGLYPIASSPITDSGGECGNRWYHP
jgi:hypothetical protein